MAVLCSIFGLFRLWGVWVAMEPEDSIKSRMEIYVTCRISKSGSVRQAIQIVQQLDF